MSPTSSSHTSFSERPSLPPHPQEAPTALISSPSVSLHSLVSLYGWLLPGRTPFVCLHVCYLSPPFSVPLLTEII